MSFSRSQQGIYRPMVSAAWAKHAASEGLNPREKTAQAAWYRAELLECLGRDTTTEANSGRDFETVMAHFEAIAGGDFRWNLRIHQGDTRRLQWSIGEICKKWQIDDAYARATAARLLKWEGYLDSLAKITDPADLQRVRIALLKHARRSGLREDKAAAQAKVAADPALNVPPAPSRVDPDFPNATETQVITPGIAARRKSAEETSRKIVREARAAGHLPKRPRAKRPARQAAPAEATIDPDNCPF